jgi:TonB-linked SusC/RagA family outer membrane protein
MKRTLRCIWLIEPTVNFHGFLKPVKIVFLILFCGLAVPGFSLNPEVQMTASSPPEVVADDQQRLNISGTVTDASTGEAMVGVNIQVKGTNIGAISDISGKYTISPPVDPNAVLVFSFIGYISQETPVGGRATIDVALTAELRGLDEVVVIGYGTQRKVNLTGSVSVATAERLESRPIASVGHGLQGVIPNLNISIRNGDPTTSADYNIRGFESINGGSPLVLVDGVPMDLERLNPNDIASVNVLKDASAAAVYGARAAFGVILVETKKGKSGKVSVTLGTEQSLTVPIYLIDPVTDPYDFVMAWNEANIRTNGAPGYDDDYVTGTKAWSENPTEENAWKVYNGTLRYYGFNDYHNKLITDYAPQNKYDLSISGATDKTSYYVSFGYINKDGYLRNKEKNENYKRYNALMKADFTVNKWLSFEDKIVFNAQASDKPHFYNWDVNINTSARKKPIEPLEFPDLEYYLTPGDHDTFAQYIGKHFGGTNFFPYLENGGRETFSTYDTWFTQGVTLSPVKGLNIKSDFSAQVYFRNYQDVASKVEVIRTQNLQEATMIDYGYSGDDWINNQVNYNTYFVINSYAEYTLEKFTNHYLKAMVGFNQEWGRNTYIRGQARSLVTPLITDLNATTGTQQTFGGKSHVALRGAFYRLNYIYKDKYLFEANGRYDGTSRFPKKDRFGFFPSISIGWRISEEPFMDFAQGWMSNLKLRASYGVLGNQLLGSNYYPYISTMGIGTSPYMMSSAGLIPYVSAAGLVSSALTWEKVATQNIGMDFALFRQRLDFSFDAYIRDTKDMLMNVEYPAILGTSAPDANAADLRTKGWEISVTWRDKFKQNWTYALNIALSDNQSEITSYDNPTGALSEYYVGQKLGEIWGYVTEGIFQTDEEVTGHADQSQLGSNWRAGDMKYADLNNDEKITPGSNTLADPGDRKIIGNSTARYSFGINPELSYKSVTLSIFFQGLFRDYLPPNDNWKAFYPYNAGHVEKYYITESWSENNRDAYFSAPTISTNTKKNVQPQSRYVQNAAYGRLKNMTLNYDLPESLITKVGISRAQVYFSGMNLFEFTKIHKPLDPESIQEITQEYYFQRIFTVGAKLTF